MTDATPEVETSNIVAVPVAKFFREQIAADECSNCASERGVYYVNSDDPEDVLDRNCYYDLSVRDQKQYVPIESIPSENSITEDGEDEDDESDEPSPNDVLASIRGEE